MKTSLIFENKNMPIDDKQLDDLLRDVSVPQNLKADLLEIPDREHETVVTPNRSRVRTAMLGTILAIAATIFVFLYIAPSEVAKVDPLADDADEIAMLLDEMQRNQDAIDEIMNVQDLAIGETTPINTAPLLDPDEVLASALSMSWQSSIDQGASVESMKKDLELVVTKYPNTRGAQRARELLQIN